SRSLQRYGEPTVLALLSRLDGKDREEVLTAARLLNGYGSGVKASVQSLRAGDGRHARILERAFEDPNPQVSGAAWQVYSQVAHEVRATTSEQLSVGVYDAKTREALVYLPASRPGMEVHLQSEPGRWIKATTGPEVFDRHVGDCKYGRATVISIPPEQTGAFEKRGFLLVSRIPRKNEKAIPIPAELDLAPIRAELEKVGRERVLEILRLYPDDADLHWQDVDAAIRGAVTELRTGKEPALEPAFEYQQVAAGESTRIVRQRAKWKVGAAPLRQELITDFTVTGGKIVSRRHLPRYFDEWPSHPVSYFDVDADGALEVLSADPDRKCTWSLLQHSFGRFGAIQSLFGQ
ncbi:MAG TPA: hypothetical protein VM598_09395, partial [Bdellovibrionota bacterium]|nr:hypothetical protein [Bdellovibrionota bacterium]